MGNYGRQMSDVGSMAAKTNLPPPSDIELMQDWAQLDWQSLLAWITGHIIISQSLDKTDGLPCICDFLLAKKFCSSVRVQHVINYDSGWCKKIPANKSPRLSLLLNLHKPLQYPT